jgi:hypothetical protein
MRKSAQTVTFRGQAEPPKDLARFIELVNADSAVELPDLLELFAGATADPVRICRDVARRFGPKTNDFLGSPESIGPFYSRCLELQSAREALGLLAKRYRDYSRAAGDVASTLPIPVTARLIVNREGLLELSPDDPVLSALDGIRADRIRSCAVCGRIFWAPRVNSECCEEKCRKTYNQKNSRENRRKLSKKRSLRKGR